MKKYPSHHVIHTHDWNWKPWLDWICEARGRKGRDARNLKRAYYGLGCISVPQEQPPSPHEEEKVKRWFEAVWGRNDVEWKGLEHSQSYENSQVIKPAKWLSLKEQMKIRMQQEGRQMVKDNVCQGKHERNVLERAFDGCPPGSQYIGVLDAIYDPAQHKQATE